MNSAHTHDHDEDELHAHGAGDAEHRHFGRETHRSVLLLAVGLTVGFAAVEVVAGFWANSLALISDASHMVTDSAALLLALLAQFVALRPPSVRHSFGFGRAEALAAFVNGLLMLAVIGWIGWAAVGRFSKPEAVAGDTVVLVAVIGLVINILVAWVLSRDRGSMNTRAALVHVFGDLLGSVAALASGAVIHFTGWTTIDPLLSLLVCLLLLHSTSRILTESFHILMEGVPPRLDYLQIGHDLRQISGVQGVHDLHIWEMGFGQSALIGHVQIDNLQDWPAILELIRQRMREHHGIDHLTLQPEPAGQRSPCGDDACRLPNI